MWSVSSKRSIGRVFGCEEACFNIGISIIVRKTFVVTPLGNDIDFFCVACERINLMTVTEASIFLARHPCVPVRFSSATIVSGTRQSLLIPNHSPICIEAKRTSATSIAAGSLRIAHIIPPSICWMGDHASAISTRVPCL